MGNMQKRFKVPTLSKSKQKRRSCSVYSFPSGEKVEKLAEKRQRWIVACHRGDTFVCSKDSYICSLHFVGENGPTPDHPDPISAIASEEKVLCDCV